MSTSWTWAALRERALLETPDVLVLDKPPGIAVTGERHDVDLVELAAAEGEILYPVHRIDKVTSGLVLLARTLPAHGPLTRQFADRTAEKAYLAVLEGAGLPERWTIDLPLGVGRKSTVRIAAPRESLTFDAAASRWAVPEAEVLPGKKNYPSVTHLERVAEAGGRTLVVARPVSGRRHQIRVHLAWTGTPITGDPLFRGEGRTFLHSWRLRLPAGDGLDVTAPPDPEFLAQFPEVEIDPG
ncbi:MAG: RNA pseudouridine synthase [Pseudonocardia sp.]|nr:RNA pseudouridine synthase [Pseudonocardia sp.]